MRPAQPRSPLSATLLGATVSIAAVLPMFLVGATAVELSASLGIDSRGLGLAVAVFHATGVVVALQMGRAVDRLGSIWSVRLAAGVSALASFGIAFLADGLAVLIAFMVLAGSANVASQPASNRLIAMSVAPRRQGVAFGIKQSAPPAGAMLSGVSVPLVVVSLGWEAAYLIAGCVGLLVIVYAGRRPHRALRPPRPKRARIRPVDRPVILRLSVAVGLAAGAAATVFTFYVEAAVRAGSSQALAGTMLAVGGLASIATRLVFGVVADRMRGDPLRLCVALLGSGASGIALLMTGNPPVMAVGVVVSLAGTWGVNGVFWYVVVRAFSYAPGTVTGATSRGLLLGAMVCPLLFGSLAAGLSMTAAWLLSLGFAVGAVLAMIGGARRLAALDRAVAGS